MQDKIRSKSSDWELLIEKGENQVYRCFELIGIYHTYQKSELPEEKFEEFYIHCIDEKRYFYRNEGVRVIHEILNHSYQGYKGTYQISKRSMRRYGKTYKFQPVIVYESSFIVLDLTLKYILENKTMKGIYLRHIHRKEIEKYLTFQYNCLADFIGAGGGARKIYYKENVRDKIEKLIESL